jgi:RNA polymerase sigma factor (sigma-70 family)
MSGVDSLHDVYMALRGSLARAVMSIVPPSEVEDIVQETYVRICRIKDPQKIRKPHSFLYKTAKNLALDHVKRAESRLAISVEDTDEFGFVEAERLPDETFDNVASNEEFAQFCEAVRRLPVQCRRAFVFKKVYGYSQREIAREMNLSENTVEKHVAKGIKRCTYFMMQQSARNKSRKRGEKPATAQRVSAHRREHSS